MRGPGGHDSVGRVARRLGVPVSHARDLIRAGAIRAERDEAGWLRLAPEEQHLLAVCGDLARCGVPAGQTAAVTRWLRSLAPEERGPAAGKICLARYERTGWQAFVDDFEVEGSPSAVVVLGLLPNAGQFGSPGRRAA